MSYRVEVQLPTDFQRLNSVQPDPVLSVDGYWYLLVYGKQANTTDPYRMHLFKWKPGSVAVHVNLAGETDARGSIGVHASGGAVFSWDGSGNYPKLICQDIPDFTPATDNSDGLSERYKTALEKLCTLLGL